MRLARPRRVYGCEINITPLIDIVFLLIIFAMVVSQFSRVQAENVNLPQARRGRRAAAPDETRLVVNVLAGGSLVVTGQPQTPAELEALLSERAARLGAANVSVVIRGDRRSPWRRVAEVLGACARRGIDNVNVAVVRPEKPAPMP